MGNTMQKIESLYNLIFNSFQEFLIRSHIITSTNDKFPDYSPALKGTNCPSSASSRVGRNTASPSMTEQALLHSWWQWLKWSEGIKGSFGRLTLFRDSFFLLLSCTTVTKSLLSSSAMASVYRPIVTVIVHHSQAKRWITWATLTNVWIHHRPS